MLIKKPDMKRKRKKKSPDGTRSLPGRLLPYTVLLFVIPLAMSASPVSAAVEKVEEGIRFTYYDPDAGQVFLAGSINGWSITANPLVKDENGYWTAVVKLSAGTHEYKFIVDGAWITDIDNPNTKADPYGGSNSIVEIDNKGEIVTREVSRPMSNTAWSSRVFIDGRYLSRMNVEKDVEDDPRWRAQRPVQNIDLNFRVTISDMVHGYTRLRIDTEDNFLQPNNIDLFLDEAEIRISPAAFTLVGFYNREILSSKDPLGLFGDINLPGTISDDHLPFGKGTAGVQVTSHQLGFDLDGFVTNVHDFDYYNDGRLFDNTGTDLLHARAARKIKAVTVGGSFFLQRDIWWLDFTGLIGQTPSNTGIARMDKYLDRTDDNSDWFEFDNKMCLYGPDVTIHLMNDELLPQFEMLWGDLTQEFVTGNNAGMNDENGPIEIPIYERDIRIAHGSVKFISIDNLDLNLEHSRVAINHPGDDESFLAPRFDYDENANKHVFFDIDTDPVTFEIDYSEFSLDWNVSRFGAMLWFQRYINRSERPTSGSDSWFYLFSVSPGLRCKPFKRLNLELEQQYMTFEGSPKFYAELSSFETIARGSFEITNRLSAIFDVRHIRLKDETDGRSENFTAPFAGIRYKPTRKVDLVLAYGVDPLNFDIDYAGRHTGRYDFRQDHIISLPDSTRQGHYGWLHPITPFYMSKIIDPMGALSMAQSGLNLAGPLFDAEQALEDKKIITLRVIYTF